MKTSNFMFRSVIFAALLLSSCNKPDNMIAAEQKAQADLVAATDMQEAGAPPPPPISITKGVVSDLDKETTVANPNASNYTKTDETRNESLAAVKIAEKIKKTADISLTVDDYKKTRAAIESIVRSGSGYIGYENEQNTIYNISNSLVIRVANKDFDRMLSSIAALEGHVNSKNVYMEDVTAQFVDITARLKSKKEVEKRYQDLLQKAVKVTDILEIEEQLRVIREEIEAKEGELKYLNDQVAYSTINLSFQQDFEFSPTQNPGFFGRMGNAFGNGWNGFLSFVVGFVYVWPLWLILGATGYFLYRFIRKLIKK